MQEPPKIDRLQRISIFQCALHKSGVSQIDREDVVVIEEPLQIFLYNRSFCTTMRTPGNDVELITGLLYGEGLIKSSNDIQQIQLHPRRANVILRENLTLSEPSPSHSDRAGITTSSCGACGSKSIDRLPLKRLFVDRPKLLWEVLFEIAPRLTRQQNLYKQSGGAHGAGLFDFQGKLLLLYEDVGRHNAVDKIVGGFLHSLQHKGYKTSETILALSGRVSFDLVQKSAQAEIPWIVAMGAPSSLAIDMAKQLNVGLAGFLKQDRLNVYHNPEPMDES